MTTAQTPQIKMTARNWINLGVITLAAAVCIASRFGYLLDGLDVAGTQTAAVAFVLGALLPGSPLGRVLDYAASFVGGPPSPPPSIQDVTALRDITRPRPTRIPSSSTPASVAAFATMGIVLGLLGGAVLHGCGAAVSDTQRAAYAEEVARCEQNERAIADRAGTTLADDERDLAAERARCDQARAEVEHPTATAIDGGL